MCTMKYNLFLAIFLSIGFLASGQLNLPIREIGNTEYYYRKVEKKETLYGISKELGISSETIIKYNPSAKDGLKKDQWLYFPVNEFAKKTSKAATNSDIKHTVKSGETIFGLSKMYSISISDLISTNPNIKHGLKTGSVIIIPSNKGRDTEEGILYTIKQGETLYRISKNNNVSIEEIMQANPGISPSNFKSGETIIIPKSLKSNVHKKHTPATVFIAEKIEKGETFEHIADKYDITPETVIEANPNNTKPKKGSYVYVPITSEIATSDSLDLSEMADSTYQTIHEINDSGKYSVSLLIPLDIDKSEISNKGNLGYDFYGGFLLALKEKANDDLNFKVNVFDITQESIYEILKKPEIKESDIIISAYEDNNLDKLYQFGEENKINIFNPFSLKDDAFYDKDRVFQISAPSSYMYACVNKFINKELSNFRIIIINEDSDEKDKELLNHIKMVNNVKNSIFVEDLEPETFKQLIPNDKKILFVPAQSSKEFLHKISTKIVNLSKATNNYNFSILGYPEWTTYRSYEPFFHKFTTYIYTRYAPTDIDHNAEKIAQEFEYWFGRKPSVTYPQMDVFGYDIANYIIKAAQEKDFDFNDFDIEFKGIHCPIYLTRVSNWGGFVNSSIYIIKYDTNNRVKKLFVK